MCAWLSDPTPESDHPDSRIGIADSRVGNHASRVGFPDRRIGSIYAFTQVRGLPKLASLTTLGGGTTPADRHPKTFTPSGVSRRIDAFPAVGAEAGNNKEAWLIPGRG
jgi:hypothetical protein